MHHTFIRYFFILSLALLTIQPTQAALLHSNDTPQEVQPSLSDEIEQKTKEAVAKLISLLSNIVKHLPQYKMPEVLDNGDIIIRRIHPEKEKAQPPEGTKI